MIVYGRIGPASFVVAPAGAVTFGGLDLLWWVVAGCTLVAATLALARMLPRRRR